MPRHKPTTSTDVDDGSDRHSRRLERDSLARNRRRARRVPTLAQDGFGLPRSLPQQAREGREIDRQVVEWRSELALNG